MTNHKWVDLFITSHLKIINKLLLRYIFQKLHQIKHPIQNLRILIFFINEICWFYWSTQDGFSFENQNRQKKTFRINFQSLLWIFFLRNSCLNGNTNCCFSEILWNCHMWFLKTQCETAKSSFEFHFLHYLCMMLLDDFSVSCRQRLLTLQFENELDGACYSLLFCWSGHPVVGFSNSMPYIYFFNR